MATEAEEGQGLTQTLMWLGGMFAALAVIAYFWI
jgi:hypothetical protein